VRAGLNSVWREGLSSRRLPVCAGHGVGGLPAVACDSPRSNARTSDSRNLRCPPGVRMLLMRPEAAHRVTVFGSTRKSAATSPGVRRRSLLPSTISPPISVSEHVFSVAKTSVYFLVFPKNEPVVLLVSFALHRSLAGPGPGRSWTAVISPAVRGKWRDVAAGWARPARGSRNVQGSITECARLLRNLVIIGSSPIAERVLPIELCGQSR
jgi:hypothetical protein